MVVVVVVEVTVEALLAMVLMEADMVLHPCTVVPHHMAADSAVEGKNLNDHAYPITLETIVEATQLTFVHRTFFLIIDVDVVLAEDTMLPTKECESVFQRGEGC